MLPLILLVVSVLVAEGSDCIPESKISSVIGPILSKRKGHHVTLSADDLVGLASLKHGCVKPIHTNPTKRVAFSAYLNHSQTFNNGVVVKFNQVQLNQGKAYNPSNGVFTCPKSGIYQITWFFLCQNPKRPGSVVWLQMDVNEKPYAYAGVPLDEIHNPGFRSHLVELKRGDRVTIVAHGTNMMVYGNSNRHTGFSALYVSA